MIQIIGKILRHDDHYHHHEEEQQQQFAARYLHRNVANAGEKEEMKNRGADGD